MTVTEGLERTREAIVGHDATTQRHRKTGLIVTLVSAALSTGLISGIALAVWDNGIKPQLVDSVVAAANDQLDQKVKAAVKTEVDPLKESVNQTNATIMATNAGVKAIISGRIEILKEEIDKLEYIRDFRREEWTNERRDELFEKRRQLRTQEEALEGIRSAEASIRKTQR